MGDMSIVIGRLSLDRDFDGALGSVGIDFADGTRDMCSQNQCRKIDAAEPPLLPRRRRVSAPTKAITRMDLCRMLLGSLIVPSKSRKASLTHDDYYSCAALGAGDSHTTPPATPRTNDLTPL